MPSEEIMMHACYCVTEHNAPLQRMDCPTPDRRGAEVLIRMTGAGVCHSDIHIWEGVYDLGSGGKMTLKDRGVALPLTMGHEISGEVVKAGPDAKVVKPGMSCVVYPWLGCGECATCKRGEENLCAVKARAMGVFMPGGYAEYVLVPHERYCVGLGKLDPAECAAGVLGGDDLFRLQEARGQDQGRAGRHHGRGRPGPYGADRASGHGRQRCRRRRYRCKKAQGCNGGRCAGRNRWRGPRRVPADRQGNGRWRIERARSRRLIGDDQLGIASIRKGGEIVLVGLYGGELKLPLVYFPLRGMGIRGSYVGSLPELKELVALAQKGTLKPIKVTRRKLQEASAALGDLKAGKVVGRIVLVP